MDELPKVKKKKDLRKIPVPCEDEGLMPEEVVLGEGLAPASVEVEPEELVKSIPKSLGSIPESDWFGMSTTSVAPGRAFVALAKISESVNGVELFESGALEEVPVSVSQFTCCEKREKKKPHDINHSSNLYY